MTTIRPHKGTAEISFGMTRLEVEQAVGKSRRRARRNAFDASELDFFDDFAVHYDERDACCAIEFARGGVPLVYEGYDLFAHPATEVRAWARARDGDLEADDGFVSRGLGLSMYAPAINDPDLDEEERSAPAQSFLLFTPGYYERERERLRRVAEDGGVRVGFH